MKAALTQRKGYLKLWDMTWLMAVSLGITLLFGQCALGQSQTERRRIHEENEFIKSEGILERYDAGDLAAVASPLAGMDYRGGGLWRGLAQGHIVHQWKKRDVFLVHDYHCTAPYLGAEMTWDCVSTIWILRPAAAKEEKGYVEVDKGMITGINADEIKLHPTLPIFAAIHAECCDGPIKTTIYDALGNELCPTFDLTDADPFAGIQGSSILCPGSKRKSTVPDWSQVLRQTRPPENHTQR